MDPMLLSNRWNTKSLTHQYICGQFSINKGKEARKHTNHQCNMKVQISSWCPVAVAELGIISGVKLKGKTLSHKDGLWGLCMVEILFKIAKSYIIMINKVLSFEILAF